MEPAQKTVKLEVTFTDRGAAGVCLQKLSRVPGLLLNVVRGRVTPHQAVYELEIRGRGRGVDAAVLSLWSAARCA